jgi:hypothetical protein
VDGMNADGVGTFRRDDPGLRRLIPVTEIRHLYRLLRDTVVSTEVHLAVVSESAVHPEGWVGLLPGAGTTFVTTTTALRAFAQAPVTVPSPTTYWQATRPLMKFCGGSSSTESWCRPDPSWMF